MHYSFGKIYITMIRQKLMLNVREMFTFSFVICIIESYVLSYNGVHGLFNVFLFSLKFLVRV